ncbi:Oidioi.mRNA.OKI2018_I69.chr1.g1335.t1.cds [Oikopleura dioica]|uniref:Oidioi.mRNA.OKI2018_I69.chr1.g1335.t1.cds n=1 Tax=Oikopleura dioica TaxID=34765 RepID=A0ABN7STY1_OIKDI|nr:Oidioi.mRNA.OKI2018_I69.chr1.g1335.t1.cds [Oikopleura dioica]
MGNAASFFSYEDPTYQNYQENKNGVSYNYWISEPSDVPPARITTIKGKPSRRYLRHFQLVDQRREEQLRRKSQKARHHNTRHVGDVLSQKEFLRLGEIDLTAFLERAPAKYNLRSKKRNRRRTAFTKARPLQHDYFDEYAY